MSVVISYTQQPDDPGDEDLQFAAALIKKVRDEIQNDERGSLMISLLDFERHINELGRIHNGNVPLTALHELIDQLLGSTNARIQL